MHFEPLRRGPLYKVTTAEFIILFPKRPLFRGFTVAIIHPYVPCFSEKWMIAYNISAFNNVQLQYVWLAQPLKKLPIKRRRKSMFYGMLNNHIRIRATMVSAPLSLVGWELTHHTSHYVALSFQTVRLAFEPWVSLVDYASVGCHIRVGGLLHSYKL